MRILMFVFFLLTLSLLQSCGCGENGLTVEGYIATNGIEARELEEGVYIIDIDSGNGITPTLDTPFKMKYTGMLTDGTIFDSNSEGFEGLLRNMIRGWQIGVRELGEGGKATLIIPSTAAYGDQARGSIPCNSTLIFDVEVIDYN